MTFEEKLLKKFVTYSWRDESRFNQIIANNPVLYKQALGTGYAAVAAAKLLLRLAWCETSKDIHALAQEYKDILFVSEPMDGKKERVQIYE